MQSDGDHYDRLACFYDLSMAGFDADIDLYEAFARRTDAPVLELGSGTGRVAFALADRGIDVSGIERSAAMQEIASHRAAGSGLPKPKLQLGDMRCPTVEGSFGLIICAIDTFLHLQNTGEQLATLTAARERLAPNGRLILDLPGLAGDRSDWQPGARPLVLDWNRDREGQTITRLSSFQADLAQQMRHVTDIYEETSADGAVRRHVVNYSLRCVFPAEMELLLERSGLVLDALYGDYDLSAFDPASERMIVVAAKALP